MNCTNCNTEVELNYCPNCGWPAELKRINGRYIFNEITQVLNLEKGIFYTIRELAIRPGENVKHFISEDRNRLVKPIVFIIVTSLFYSIIVSLLNIEDTYIKYGELDKSSISKILQWIQNHYGYANIMMGVFIAFFTKLFFRKYKYNFYEILILLCFVMGMGMLFLGVFAIFQKLMNFNVTQIAGILFLGYSIWAIGQFFDKKKVVNYFKAFASYMLGSIMFMLSAVMLGVLIDLIK